MVSGFVVCVCVCVFVHVFVCDGTSVCVCVCVYCGGNDMIVAGVTFTFVVVILEILHSFLQKSMYGH